MLPDLSQILKLPLESKGEPPFDELHGLFDGHFPVNCYQEMYVIRHDDEIMELKFALRDIRTHHVDQKRRIPFGL